MNHRQLQVIEYLREENQVLREQITSQCMIKEFDLYEIKRR